jgi:uncharacterized protein (DUF302 family)
MLEDHQSVEIVTKLTRLSVKDTVARFVDILSTKNLTLFAVIDQSQAAADVGMVLRETILVIFGDPRAGTPVMETAPMAALDLPLKILIWSDDERTKVSYVAPRSLAGRYELKGELATKFDGIDPLTDAVVAPA